MRLEEDKLRLNVLFYELAERYGVEKALEMFEEATEIVKLISSLKEKEEK